MDPLRFEPLFKRYIWGGRRLESQLGKQLPPGEDYAESWELVDHGPDQSVVLEGPLSGTTLHELLTEHGPTLLGHHHPQPQFPLLFKFLDAHRNLSVQVHPNDAQGAKLDPPDLGKTEAWVILHADPGSTIYAGLKEGVDHATFQAAIEEGTAEECLNQFHPQAGDCVFIPAGTVHALGAGIVVAEIQQASNTTFRLFDWNRVDAEGNSRPLHIDQGLAVIDWSRGPVSPAVPVDAERAGAEQLVHCDYFVLERWTLTQSSTLATEDRLHILVLLEGRLQVGSRLELTGGELAVLPASLGEIQLTPSDDCLLLDIHLPD